MTTGLPFLIMHSPSGDGMRRGSSMYRRCKTLLVEFAYFTPKDFRIRSWYGKGRRWEIQPLEQRGLNSSRIALRVSPSATRSRKTGNGNRSTRAFALAKGRD